MNAYTTHPSVRIKGTENNYEPVACMSSSCPNKMNAHMHCPFCVKTDYYVDPVILKAHYRVKHVDKGIEFAGLKVLRCCDHCDIVGTIKGVKEFKGAHWHCYKCRNGFNRRDEALKHYRTHFRNPQTTFQIQITQEVNRMSQLVEETEQATNSVTQESISVVHPALSEGGMTISSSDAGIINVEPGNTLSNGKSGDGEVHVSIAANETVGAETETIMIIHEGHLDASQVTSSSLDSSDAPTQSFQVQNIMQESIEVESGDEIVPLSTMDHVAELQQQVEQLGQEKTQIQQQLQEEINQLEAQVQMQGEEISNYQKREQELLTQLSIPLDERIQELLSQLKSDHEDLLHQQLAVLRRTYLQQFAPTMPTTIIKNCSENSVESADIMPNHVEAHGTTDQDLDVVESKVSLAKGQSSDILIFEDESRNYKKTDHVQDATDVALSDHIHTISKHATAPANSDITIHVLQLNPRDGEITGEAVSLAEVVSSDTSLTVQASNSPSFDRDEISERTSPPPEKKPRPGP